MGFGRFTVLAGTVAVAVSLLLSGCGGPSPAKVRTFSQRVGNSDPQIRAAAVDEAPAMGPAAVAPLADLMAGSDAEVVAAAGESIRRIAQAASVKGSTGAQSHATAAELIKLLRPQRPRNVRVLALELLPPLVSSNREVTAMAVLLHDTEVRQEALAALERTPGQEPTVALVNVLDTADPEFRPSIINALSARGDASAVAAIEKWKDSPDPATALAATIAVASLKDQDYSDLLSERWATAATAAEKVALIQAIAPKDAASMKSLLRRAQGDGNADVRRAAVEAMAKSGDPSFQDDLLSAVQFESPAIRSVALGGYLCIADRALGTGDSGVELLNQYRTALKLADTPENRSRAIAGLTAIANADYLKQAAGIADEAEQVTALKPYIEAAATLAHYGDKQQGIDLLLAMAAFQLPQPSVDSALSELKQLGVPGSEYSMRAGFLPTWWVLGLFPNPENIAATQSFLPEPMEVDITKEVQYQGKSLTWQKYSATEMPGIVKLHELYGPGDDLAAYGYMELTSPTARNIKFKSGSDDGLIIWLNGEKVYSATEYRGTKVDGDVVVAKLKAGKNTFFIKLTQGRYAWEYVIRMTTPDDKPIDVSQMKVGP